MDTPKKYRLKENLLFLLGSLCVMLGSTPPVQGQSSDAEVIFQVVNIKNKSGQLIARLYDNSASWEKKGNDFVREKIIALSPTSPNAIFVKFDDLEVGHYAASFVVDNNKNGKMDTDPKGNPKEQFTFSRPPQQNLSVWKYNQPFDDVKFEYVGSDIRIIVKVE